MERGVVPLTDDIKEAFPCLHASLVIKDHAMLEIIRRPQEIMLSDLFLHLEVTSNDHSRSDRNIHKHFEW